MDTICPPRLVSAAEVPGTDVALQWALNVFPLDVQLLTQMETINTRLTLCARMQHLDKAPGRLRLRRRAKGRQDLVWGWGATLERIYLASPLRTLPVARGMALRWTQQAGWTEQSRAEFGACRVPRVGGDGPGRREPGGGAQNPCTNFLQVLARLPHCTRGARFQGPRDKPQLRG